MPPSRKSIIAVAIGNALSFNTQAAEIFVGPDCTIVEAIQSAEIDNSVGSCEAGDGADVIFLPASSEIALSQPYDNAGNLDTATPTITSEVVIQGQGATLKLADSAPPMRLLNIEGPGDLTVHNTTISDGFSNFTYYQDMVVHGACVSATGGASLNLQNVTVQDCGFEVNFFGRTGNAITIEDSTLTVKESTITGNAGSESAIRAFDSTVSIYDSDLTENRAHYSSGALSTFNSSVTVSDSTFSRNYSAKAGGGAMSFSRSEVEIRKSVITRNLSDGGGGAIRAFASNMSIALTTLHDNSTLSRLYVGEGGALFISGGETSIYNSTLSNNQSSYYFYTLAGFEGVGGAISLHGGNLSLFNSTLSNNRAESGYGPYLSEGGGHSIYNKRGQIELNNTIVAGFFESVELCLNNDGGVVEAGSNNIIQDGSCGTNAKSVDPLLGELESNQSDRLTNALSSGSPAIDMGSAAICRLPKISGKDQRGFKHVGRCDLGAFEFGAFPRSPLEDPRSVIPGMLLLLDDDT